MDTYFVGTKVYGPYEMPIDGDSVSYTITEKWISTNRSHTVRCGVNSKIAAGTTTSVSVSESEEFKSAIKSTLGVTSIASISAHIEANTKISTTFSASETLDDSFECPAPACGRYTYFLYQLVRDYRVIVKKTRLFRKPLIVPRDFRERTRHFDIRRETHEQDLACPCDSPSEEEEGDEIVVLDLGSSR